MNPPPATAGNETSAETALSLVLFLVDGRQYGLPLARVERVLPMVEITPLPQAPPIVLGVINLRGTVLPVVDLRRRFGLIPGEYGLSSHLLIAHSHRRTLALPVDEAVGVSTVSPEAVSPPEALFPGISQLSGVAACGAELLFIQDLDALLSLDEELCLAEALREPAP